MGSLKCLSRWPVIEKSEEKMIDRFQRLPDTTESEEWDMANKLADMNLKNQWERGFKELHIPYGHLDLKNPGHSSIQDEKTTPETGAQRKWTVITYDNAIADPDIAPLIDKEDYDDTRRAEAQKMGLPENATWDDINLKRDFGNLVPGKKPQDSGHQLEASMIEELAKTGNNYANHISLSSLLNKGPGIETACEGLQDFLSKTKQFDDGSGLTQRIVDHSIHSSNRIKGNELGNRGKLYFLQRSLQLVADLATGRVGGPLPSLLSAVATTSGVILSPEDKEGLYEDTLHHVAREANSLATLEFANIVSKISRDFHSDRPVQMHMDRVALQEHALNMIKNGEIDKNSRTTEVLKKYSDTLLADDFGSSFHKDAKEFALKRIEDQLNGRINMLADWRV